MKAVFEIHPVVNGSGRVKFAWQRSVGNYLAVSGVNKVVNIYDRHGEHQNGVIILLPGLCTSLDWDRDGDVLAVTQDKNGMLHLWSTHSPEVIKLDSGMKEHLTVCAWAKTSNQLAVGTARGNLLLYNHRSRRCIHIDHKKIWKVLLWMT
jgi:WD repeat-containing protein 19